MIIVIAETFKDDYTTRRAGERLRLMIKDTSEKVTLDFVGIKIASASFFDEGIAKLTDENWDQSQFDKLLEVVNLYELDQRLLKQVCKARSNITLNT